MLRPDARVPASMEGLWEEEDELLQFIEKYGRHDWIRTSDLFRVK
jgi:hypothetical protein